MGGGRRREGAAPWDPPWDPPSGSPGCGPRPGSRPRPGRPGSRTHPRVPEGAGRGGRRAEAERPGGREEEGEKLHTWGGGGRRRRKEAGGGRKSISSITPRDSRASSSTIMGASSRINVHGTPMHSECPQQYSWRRRRKEEEEGGGRREGDLAGAAQNSPGPGERERERERSMGDCASVLYRRGVGTVVYRRLSYIWPADGRRRY